MAYHRPASGFVARLLGALPMNLLPARLVGGGRAPVLGVRPERVRLAGDAATLLRGRVMTVEPGGEESVVHIDVDHGHTRMLVRTRACVAPAPGDEVALDWDAADTHWFASPDGPRVP